MLCPHCCGDITRHVRKDAKTKAAKFGAIGGSAAGESKRRNVDYAALGRKGAEARKAKQTA